MKPGDRLASRYTITREAPGEDRVVRFEATADDRGTVEILALRPTSDADDAAERRFAEQHRGLMAAADPALVTTFGVHKDAHGRAIVARARTDDATLADLDPGNLHPRTVAALGARLLPAVLAAGVHGGTLLADDIGLDREGLPVLAIRGRPAVYDAVARRHVAPEVLAGKPAERTSALFGLGVVLHRLATGRDPVLAPGGTAPPASSWRSDLPPALDQALALLLSPDPALRPGAQPLLMEASGVLSDLRPKLLSRRAERSAASDPVRYTTTSAAGSRGRPDRREDDVGALIALSADALRALDGRGRSAAAAWAGVTVAEVARIRDAGQPLVFAAVDKSGDAQARADVISAESGLPVAVVSGWTEVPTRVGGCAVAGVAATLGAIALPAAVVWLPAIAIAAVLAVIAAVAMVGSVSKGDAGFDDLLAQWRGRAGAAEGPDVRRVRERIASLRRRIHAGSLPEPAANDLRADLLALEENLEILVRSVAIADQTLGAADILARRTDLARLTAESTRQPALAAERDRTAKIVADLEDVAARRGKALDEVAHVLLALDRLDARFANTALADQVSEGMKALDDLARDVRLTTEALASDEVTARKPGSARETE